jgi:hypothetical protein
MNNNNIKSYVETSCVQIEHLEKAAAVTSNALSMHEDEMKQMNDVILSQGVCIGVCIGVCVCVLVCVYWCVCMCVCVCVGIGVCVLVFVFVYMCIGVCMSVY